MSNHSQMLALESSESPWFLAGYGGMVPYDSPLRSPVVEMLALE